MRIVKVTESRGGGAGDEVKSFTIWGEGTGAGKGWGKSETKQAESPRSQGSYQASYLKRGGASTTWRMTLKRHGEWSGHGICKGHRGQSSAPSPKLPKPSWGLLRPPRALRSWRTWNTWAPTRVTEQKQRAEVTCGWYLNGEEKMYLLPLAPVFILSLDG